MTVDDSQADAAQSVGVATGTVGEWEREEAVPHPSSYPRIAKYLGWTDLESLAELINAPRSPVELVVVRERRGAADDPTPADGTKEFGDLANYWRQRLRAAADKPLTAAENNALAAYTSLVESVRNSTERSS